MALPERTAQVPVERWWVEVDGAVLAAAALGAPTDPAWVVAHGIGSSARFIADAFTDAVLARGRRLVVYDLRGHGASSPAPLVADHHLDVHARDLAAVAQHCGGDIEVVGGISLGAHAAVRAVTAGRLVDPPAALLGCLPAWLGASVPGSGAHAAIARRVREVGVETHCRDAAGDPSLAPWLRRALAEDLLRHDVASLTAALLALDGADAPSREELAGLGPPIGVLGWADDPGHPLAVAEVWAAIAVQGALVRLSLRELDVGVERLGAHAVAVVTAALSAVPPPGAGDAHLSAFTGRGEVDRGVEGGATSGAT